MAQKNLPQKNQFRNKIIKDYLLEEEIGRGKIGVVYRAHHKDIQNLKVAIKIVPQENLKNDWKEEVNKAGLLTGITQAIQLKDSPIAEPFLNDVPYVCIFWEYIPGDNLREYAKNNPNKINLPFIKCLIEEILNLFIAMKQRGVTHGDLHEGNILITYDERLRYPTEPVIKVGDFGIGGSRNDLDPKNDYDQLAFVCSDLLKKYIDPSQLDGGNRYFYDKLVEEFLPKMKTNQTVGDFVREPRKLLDHLDEIRDSYYASKSIQPIATLPLKHPFDYLSCEEMGDSFEVLQTLYSKNFPGYDVLLQRTNTILTGPRGCGKTTIFRNLSLKAQLLGSKKQTIEDLDDYVGIYYHCIDLYFAFPYLKDELSEIDRRVIIHFFNLAILYEILDALLVSQEHLPVIGSHYNFNKLQAYLQKWLPSYKTPLIGIPVLYDLLSFIAQKKEEIKTWMEMGKPDSLSKPFLPLDFIKNICGILQETIPWLKGRSIYFFLDDYSLPRISKPIQETLHDFILHRYSECFFKISTESIITFYPYDSKGKLLEETREYDIIDLGAYFLHSSKEVKDSFLVGVINNRLKNTKDIHTNCQDIRTILGVSKRNNVQLAKEIRGLKPGERVYYYGWNMIVDLCSGDVANVLCLIRDIISLSGGPEKFSKPNGIPIPIDEKEQDRAIREISNGFLNRIESVPNVGTDLRKITEAFGNVANWYLRHRDSKNQKQIPPWQAFRLEVRDALYFEDSLLKKAKGRYNLNKDITPEKLKELYDALIKYGIFLRDVRGKSIGGAVVPRLYLRRLLIPTFLLTPSQRDSIAVTVSEFFMLLSDPDKFRVHMEKEKSQIESGQMEILL